MGETEYICEEHRFYSYDEPCPYCAERKLRADCERYRLALQAIAEHQQIVGAPLAKLSSTVAIAKKALSHD